MSDTLRRITLYLDRLYSDLPNTLRSKESVTFELLLAPEAIRAAEETAARRLKEAGAPSKWAMVGMAFEDQYLVILREAVRFPCGYSAENSEALFSRGGDRQFMSYCWRILQHC